MTILIEDSNENNVAVGVQAQYCIFQDSLFTHVE